MIREMRERLLTDILTDRLDHQREIMKTCSEPHVWHNAFQVIKDSLKTVSEVLVLFTLGDACTVTLILE